MVSPLMLPRTNVSVIGPPDDRSAERAPASRTTMGSGGAAPATNRSSGLPMTGRPSERQRAGRRWGPGAQPPQRIGHRAGAFLLAEPLTGRDSTLDQET